MPRWFARLGAAGFLLAAAIWFVYPTATVSALAPYGGVTPSGGGGDWAQRSTASGVGVAVAFSNATDVSTYLCTSTCSGVADPAVQPTYTANIGPFGQPGAVLYTASNSDTTGGGTELVPFAARGQNTTFYVSWRQYGNLHYWAMTPPTSDGTVQGAKQIILGGATHSHTNFEVVLENGQQHDIVDGYWANNSVSFNYWETSYTSGCCGFDFKFQPQIANDGTGATISPDSVYSIVNGGTDPDTGTAFNAFQIEWSRIGGSFNSQTESQGNGAFAWGLGFPLGGGVRYPANQWATYEVRVDVGTWDTMSSRIRVAVAPEGQGWLLLEDTGANGAMLGSDSTEPNGFAAGWLTNYYTLRTAGGVHVASRSGSAALESCLDITNVSNGTAAGAGTLSWTASTHTLTWAEFGGSAGTARGLASWKKYVNVFTSGGTDDYLTGKYLGLNVTNFASCPATNATDTVTIASNRDTQTTAYAEFIESAGPINATAYNSSGVQIGPSGGYSPPF